MLPVKFRGYEKATKFEKISHLFWQNSCFYSEASKQLGDFFKFLQPFQKSWTLIFLFFCKQLSLVVLKSSFSENATKLWKNLPLVLTLLSKNSCFVKTGGRFFPILWPSHNVLTLSWQTLFFTSNGKSKCYFLPVDLKSLLP